MGHVFKWGLAFFLSSLSLGQLFAGCEWLTAGGEGDGSWRKPDCSRHCVLGKCEMGEARRKDKRGVNMGSDLPAAWRGVNAGSNLLAAWRGVLPGSLDALMGLRGWVQTGELGSQVSLWQLPLPPGTSCCGRGHVLVRRTVSQHWTCAVVGTGPVTGRSPEGPCCGAVGDTHSCSGLRVQGRRGHHSKGNQRELWHLHKAERKSLPWTESS